MWHDAKRLNSTANRIFLLVALACAAACLWWLAQRPMFTLRLIRIESIASVDFKHVDPLTLRNGALARIKGNFFTANLDSVRLAFEAAPWVRRAMVRRAWPNQLVVELEEYEVLGSWGTDGRLLSTTGDVFTANLAEAEEDRVLPQFAGPEGSEKEVLARFDALRGWFAPLHLRPEGLALSSRYAWTVKLDSGMSVALGREQNKTTLKERVEQLARIYPQLVSRLKNIDSIDMRYPDGLALSSSALVLAADGKRQVPAPHVKNSPSTLTRTHL